MAPDPKERLIVALVDSTNAVEESTETLARAVPLLLLLESMLKLEHEAASEERRARKDRWSWSAILKDLTGSRPFQKFAMGAVGAAIIVMTAAAGWAAAQLSASYVTIVPVESPHVEHPDGP